MSRAVSPKRQPHPRTASRSSQRPDAEREWIFGRRPAPFLVERPTPRRPHILLLVEAASGVVTASEVIEPDMPDAEVAGWVTAALPEGGRLRLEDERLAAAVRPLVEPGHALVVAPAPELDRVLASLAEWVGSESPDELPWRDDATLEARLAFYKAATAFERAKPWSIASDSQLLELRAPALGRERACVSILGAAGESFGLLLFDSLADYIAMTRLAALAPEERAHVQGAGAPVFAVHYDDPADLPGGAALERRARALGWKPGKEGRVPLVVKMGGDGAPQPVGDADYRLATACLQTVGPFVEQHRRLFRPPNDKPASAGPASESRHELATAAGPVEVIVAAPPDVPWEWGREEPLAGLTRKAADALIDRFRADRRARGSDEAEVVKAAGHVAEALRYRLSRQEPVAGWGADDIQAYLLDYYPAKGVAPDEDLALVPASLDAFFEWLATTEGADPGAIAAVRGRLERCRDAFLRYASDPRRFSQSKTLVRAARAEGVDLGDAKALDAFVKRFKRRLARDPSLLPPPGPVPRKAWIWTPGQPVPDAKGECPCGSGKRYRKCCMPR
jgi:hypothetical protein